MNIALIIIDVQKAMDHPKWGARNNPDAESKILVLLDFWRSVSMPVFHIKDCPTDPTSPYHDGQTLHDFKDCVKPLDDETIIKKRSGNAFEGTTLDDGLKSHCITDIIVAGVHTQHCVAATVHHALKLGYNVTVVSDATVAVEDKQSSLTADQAHLYALSTMEQSGAILKKASDVL